METRDLKVGDVFYSFCGEKIERKNIITRVTKTIAFVGYTKYKIRCENGIVDPISNYGGMNYIYYLANPTHDQARQKKQLVKYLSEQKRQTMDVFTLEKIKRSVDEFF